MEDNMDTGSTLHPSIVRRLRVIICKRQGRNFPMTCGWNSLPKNWAGEYTPAR